MVISVATCFTFMSSLYAQTTGMELLEKYSACMPVKPEDNKIGFAIDSISKEEGNSFFVQWSCTSELIMKNPLAQELVAVSLNFIDPDDTDNKKNGIASQFRGNIGDLDKMVVTLNKPAKFLIIYFEGIDSSIPNSEVLRTSPLFFIVELGDNPKLLDKSPRYAGDLYNDVLKTTKFGQAKRYGIENVVLKKRHFLMNKTTMDETTYIADYGCKESSECKMSHPGGLSTTLFSMYKEGFVYMIVEVFDRRNRSQLKQYTKTDISQAGENMRDVNFLDLTDEIKEKFQIEEKGIEQFLGKECTKYEMNIPNQGQDNKLTVLVWQGLILKMTDGSTVREVTEIQENAVIASEKFQLPEGVYFEEQILKNK